MPIGNRDELATLLDVEIWYLIARSDTAAQLIRRAPGPGAATSPRGNPTATIKGAMPAYYSKLDQIATLWFSVIFRLLANPRPLLEVISACRAPSMLVHRCPC